MKPSFKESLKDILGEVLLCLVASVFIIAPALVVAGFAVALLLNWLAQLLEKLS